jgi:nucleoside-diphosphate-sugar epimerase
VPIVVHRPSIVVGRSDSGATTDYKTIYRPMRLLVRSYDLWPSVLNRLVPVPVWPDTRLDVVPVDWLVSAMAALFRSDAADGRCFHLAAGPTRSASVRELAVATCELFGTPQVRIRPPGPVLRGVATALRPIMARLDPRTTAILDVMYDYGRGMPDFDTTNAAHLCLVAPRVVDYFQRLVRFATSTDYGRRRAGDTPGNEPSAIVQDTQSV